MSVKHLILRNGIWHYKRRVPKRAASIDHRGTVRLSTEQREHDLDKAIIVRDRINQANMEFWSTASIDRGAALSAYEVNVKRALALGFQYVPAKDLANGALADLAGRLAALERSGLYHSEAATAAVLGGGEVAGAALPLSQVLKQHELHNSDQLRTKSKDQLRKWRNPKKRALRNVGMVLGNQDIDLFSITRTQALEFRQWWMDRMQSGEVKTQTANKELSNLVALFNSAIKRLQLDVKNPFAELSFEESGGTDRLAYDKSYVQNEILAPGRLKKLNFEARSILFLVAALGIRPSEACALTQSRIKLDAVTPHIVIAPDGRQLKSGNAVRTIPIHGLALAVLTSNPNGFPKYFDRPDSFSAAANKALGVAKLRPSPKHSVYSLRHTFQDLLTNAQVPPRVDHDLFGHALNREKYGAGASLQLKLEWLKKVSYSPSPGLLKEIASQC